MVEGDSINWVPKQLTVHLSLLRWGSFRNFLDTRRNFSFTEVRGFPPACNFVWSGTDWTINYVPPDATPTPPPGAAKAKGQKVRLSGMKKNAHTCRCPGTLANFIVVIENILQTIVCLMTNIFKAFILLFLFFTNYCLKIVEQIKYF